MPDTNEIVDRLLTLAQQAREERRAHEPIWQDVADLIAPSRSFTHRRAAGSRHRDDILFGHAQWARTLFANALFGFFSNPAITWMGLAAIDPEIDERSEARRWLHRASQQLLAFFGSEASGFAAMSHETYKDIVDFGIAVGRRVPTRGGNYPIRLCAEPLAEFSFLGGGDDERGTGRIDMIFREVMIPARAMVARWPDTVSDETRRLAAKPETANQRVDVVHAVYERDGRNGDPMRSAGPDKPWASIYIEKKPKRLLAQGGFNRRPFYTPRWSPDPGAVFGESPSINALAEVRMGNKVREQRLIAGDLANRPPMVVDADSLEGPLSMQPGGVTYLSRAGATPPTPVKTGANPAAAEAILAEVMAEIDKHYHIDLIRLPAISPQGGHPRMTAFEVSMRLMQEMQILSPTVARIEQEFLGPVISDTFAAFLEAGIIEPPPDVLAGAALKVTYMGPLALSQRASEATGYFQWQQAIQPLLQADPNLQQDLIDADYTARRLGAQFNTDPRFMRPEREVTRRRAVRAEQQQAVEQVTAARELAGAFKDAGAGLKDTIAANAGGV